MPAESRSRPEILLVNANTTPSITQKLVDAAAVAYGADWTFRGITAPFGAPYISTREAAATAAEAVAAIANEIAAASALPAAFVISCFGDPGLWAARDRLAIPVVGMAEASCHLACQTGRRFAIVTGGRAWGPMLEEFVASIGLASRLASIRTLELTGDQVAADPDRAAGAVLAEIHAAEEDGADCVVIGGAGLISIAARLQPEARVPLLDSLGCALAAATALVRIRKE
jgi:Asp/Glu/hydantoin racemase